MAETMRDRLLMFVRGPRFRALVGTFAERTEHLRAVAIRITQSFGLEDATGHRLDVLGDTLQRPRSGESDDRYRVLLQIQVQLILASQATTAVLLEIVRLFTERDAPEYVEHDPAYIDLGAVVGPTETIELAQLLGQARAGGVRVTLLAQDEDALVADYTPDPVEGAGLADYTPDPVEGAGTTSYEVPT